MMDTYEQNNPEDDVEFMGVKNFDFWCNHCNLGFRGDSNDHLLKVHNLVMMQAPACT